MEELIECLERQTEGYKKQINELEKKKLNNKVDEEVNVKLNSLLTGDSAKKVMRYEKSIQKSIYQNLAVLKRLQSLS